MSTTTLARGMRAIETPPPWYVSALRPFRGIRGLLPLITLLAIWQIVGDQGSFSFPPPNTWVESIVSLTASGRLLPALGSTLLAFALGLALAVLLGVAGGIAIGSLPRLDRAVSPVLEFFRTLPAPVYVPLAALLLGSTLIMGAGVVAAAAIWPILLNTIAGVRAIPPVRFDTARVLRLGPVATVFKVLIPSVATATAIGLRVAVPIALIVTLLVDILGSGMGAGRILLERQQSYDASGVFGLLLVIGAFGYFLNLGMAAAERRLLRNWSDASAD